MCRTPGLDGGITCHSRFLDLLCCEWNISTKIKSTIFCQLVLHYFLYKKNCSEAVRKIPKFQ
jgi:hypothetical protein